MACKAGCIKTVELLIQHDQTVINSENRVGETPAMFAAVSGQTETLEILLAKNAKLWAETHCRSAGERKTCLDWAVLGGKPETVKAIFSILEHDTWMEVGLVLVGFVLEISHAVYEFYIVFMSLICRRWSLV